MNLLPKSYSDFGEKDYWNSFFQKRGKQAFDWYGEYFELASHLHKYIKNNDSILISGCGNSTLGSSLFDAGFKSITNIDVSEVVIKQMNKINKHRSEMKFLIMDALNMSFDDESFNVVLDKGTLDALMPDNTEESNFRIDKYFDEINRVLKLNGRFIIISLLQEHILRKLLSWFEEMKWLIRIIRCREAESNNQDDVKRVSLPVFIVVITKFKPLLSKILEVSLVDENIQRLNNSEEVESIIKSVQNAAFVANGVANNSLVGEDDVKFEMCRPNECYPRYTIHISDQLHFHPSQRYGVFIVPQGRESEWMFATSEGRRELINSVRFGRLVIVSMNRDQIYGDLESVKEELADAAKTLAPVGYSGQIPFMSLGSDVGKRIKVYEGTSKLSGDFVIEDVEVEGDMFRRLIFKNNQFLIQSEVKLKKGAGKQSIDLDYISCSHHIYMCIGVNLMKQCENIAVIGLGGGSLCMILRRQFKTLDIVGVDIDEVVCDIAKDYFGLKTDDKLQVMIDDGMEFLKKEYENDKSYSAILFDVDSKDSSVSMSCPPKEFVEDAVLENVVKLLRDKGYFILNLVCRETKLRDDVVTKLKKHFKQILSFKIEQEVNEVLVCSNSIVGFSEESVRQAANSLNKCGKRRGKCNYVEIDKLLANMKIDV